MLQRLRNGMAESLAIAFFVFPALARAGALRAKIPVLVDTDIGTDIDDAFALALVARSPELKLLGVTTVSGDTRARARLAAKLLWVAGLRSVPVAAGVPGKPLPIEQARWAKGFRSPELLREDAVAFLKSEILRQPGKITLIAIGPLTNLGALLKSDPALAGKIKRIVMMGGSIAHGYDGDRRPVAEYNVASDPSAAQVVFSSGVRILMCPLDVTAMLQLRHAARHRIFTELTPLTNALTLLYHLWNQRTPTLFDPMAVAMVMEPSLCRTQPLAIRVDAQGYTRVVKGQPPNAKVALDTHPAKFFRFYLRRVAPERRARVGKLLSPPR
jgi:inosine-uridine nucleoside N-ribohydrolase